MPAASINFSSLMTLLVHSNEVMHRSLSKYKPIDIYSLPPFTKRLYQKISIQGNQVTRLQ